MRNQAAARRRIANPFHIRPMSACTVAGAAFGLLFGAAGVVPAAAFGWYIGRQAGRTRGMLEVSAIGYLSGLILWIAFRWSS